MTSNENTIRQRARADADTLENERPPFDVALEVAHDLCEGEDGPDDFLAAVATLGEERAAEIYGAEWDAILREAQGGAA